MFMVRKAYVTAALAVLCCLAIAASAMAGSIQLTVIQVERGIMEKIETGVRVVSQPPMMETLQGRDVAVFKKSDSIDANDAMMLSEYIIIHFTLQNSSGPLKGHGLFCVLTRLKDGDLSAISTEPLSGCTNLVTFEWDKDCYILGVSSAVLAKGIYGLSVWPYTVSPLSEQQIVFSNILVKVN